MNAPISVYLPDGAQKQLPAQSSVLDLAMSISSGLAQAAVAGQVDGRLVDLSYILQPGQTVSIVKASSSQGLEVIRHSTAHLMAMAIQQEFPGTQVTVGPVVENQFFYDIYPPAGVRIGLDQFQRIEECMHRIAAQDYKVTRRVFTRSEAVKYFEERGETFKVELIGDIPQGEEISVYDIGSVWADLCRGPHVPHVSKLQAFKLLSVSGAYWRANKDNVQLTRIYGTAWSTKKELETYLFNLEEAKKRDHVLLGKQLELFVCLSEVAPGAPFFLPHGAKLFVLLQNYIRKQTTKYGFQEIVTPQIMNVDLWKTSGHYEKYRDDMYLFRSDEEEFGIKPMSCPGHVRLFMASPKSYRDLPLRYSEFGTVHRNELSGTLHGLTRVRRFTQDDGHIFCTFDQIHTEILSTLRLVKECYRDLGFDRVHYNLSTRPEQRLGSDELWDKAEKDLEDALKTEALDYEIKAGDGAFYGPKIDIMVQDALSRWHQCATIQLDFQMPQRFDASYVSSKNSAETPVMIHRAVLGSIERFMGVFIEHCAGHFPIGLAPEQVRVMCVSQSQEEYALQVQKTLLGAGLRCHADLGNDKLGYKIRNAQLKKIPYMLVIGDNEVQAGTVQPRYRDGKNLDPMTPENFIEHVKKESGVFWGIDVNQR